MSKLLLLLPIGLLLIVVGVALVFLGSATQVGSSVGGFILIGPFPVVFGTGPSGGQLATLALAAGLVMVALFAVLAWRFASAIRGNSRGNA